MKQSKPHLVFKQKTLIIKPKVQKPNPAAPRVKGGKYA